MFGVVEVKGEATEASSSDREIPLCALFKAWDGQQNKNEKNSAAELAPEKWTMLSVNFQIFLISHLLHFTHNNAWISAC